MTSQQELFNVLGYLPDPESKQFWEKYIGSMSITADWNKFITSLAEVDPRGPVSPTLEKHLIMVLDQARTATLSIHKLAAVLKWAGPISQLTKNLETLLNKPYFHPFLSFEDTELLLQNQSPGRFLIRFRQSLPGTFTAAVKLPEEKVTISQPPFLINIINQTTPALRSFRLLSLLTLPRSTSSMETIESSRVSTKS